MRMFRSLYTQDNVYRINGSTYVVTAEFRHHGNIHDDPTFDKCVKKMLKSDVVPLPTENSRDTMTAENVCSAAGKEDNNAVEEEN